MILSTILGLILLLIIWIYIFLYYRPKRTIAKMVKTFQSLGYKVYAYDFAFMGHGIINQATSDIKLKKDGSYSERYLMPGYDVAVTNFLSEPIIVLLSPELIKHSVSAEKTHILHKRITVLKLFVSMI